MPSLRKIYDALPAALIFLASGAALLYHLIVGKLDGVAVVLICLGLSPFLAAIVESVSVGNTKLQFRVSKNEADIDDLKFIVGHFLTGSELRWLVMFEKDIDFPIDPKHW